MRSAGTPTIATRPLRVLHVVPAVFGADGQLGGAERYAAELARAMQTVADVRILSYGDRSATLDLGGVHVDVVRGRPIRGNPYNRIAARALTQIRNADVVHCHQQSIISSTAFAVMGRLTRRPVVVTDHGGGGWDLSQYVSTDRWYSAHLHVSAFSCLQRRQNEMASASIIYAGVDTNRFAPAAWDRHRRHCLFVGRVLPHKGVHNLIDALPAGMTLDVVGPLMDERYARDLHARASGKRVVFRGTVTEVELAAAYRRACCVVLPSVCDDLYGGHTDVPELLGQTLLEGMASGIPAVCSDAGGMPEVVVDGVTGFVVGQNDVAQLHDRLHLIATDPDTAKALGASARAHVEARFTWDQVVVRCMRIYRKLLGRADERAPSVSGSGPAARC